MKSRKVSKPRALSWKPRLRGAVYCAPACGRGCTKAAYDEARREAAEIVKQLGSGWKIEMSENLGWVAAAVCGDVKVEATRGFEDPDYRFWALVNVRKTPAHGPGGILYDVYGKTAREALSTLLSTLLRDASESERVAAHIHMDRASELQRMRTALIALVVKEVTG